MTDLQVGPVLWDVDGTLAATTELGFSATNATLASSGLRRISRREYEVRTRLNPSWILGAHRIGSLLLQSLVAAGRRWAQNPTL
jgi:phosphoglycolate phosphatase-like HAD superfamily hydrolase